MKRGRNQRRRQGSNPNRALDSNGPEVRIRGTANQIYDKYITLARDATTSGDRIKGESYLQYAEHYFRLIRLQQPAQPLHQSNQPQQAQNEGAAEQPALDNGEENKGGRRDDVGRRNGAGSAANQSDRPEPSADSGPNDAGEMKKPRRRRAPRKPVKDADESSSGETAAEGATTAVE